MIQDIRPLQIVELKSTDDKFVYQLAPLQFSLENNIADISLAVSSPLMKSFFPTKLDVVYSVHALKIR